LQNFISANRQRWPDFFTELQNQNCPLEVKQWIVSDALPQLAKEASFEFVVAYFNLLALGVV